MNYQLNKIYSDYANVHEICREVLDVSNQQDIEAVLIGGSLLGIVRDKDFLPWDKDLDFAVFENDIQKTLELEPEYRRLGYECRVHHLGVRQTAELQQGLSLIDSITHSFEQIRLDHCVIGGTLLNLYRDHVLFPETDTLGFVINPNTGISASDICAAIEHLGDLFVNQTDDKIKSITLITQNWRVNFFLYVESQHGFGWLDLNCEHWFDKALFPVEKHHAGSVRYYSPANTESFLQARFGKNWQQAPKAKFSQGRVVGSVQLYKDGVMFDFIMHYVRGDKTYWYEPAANVISTKGFIPYSMQDTTAGEMLVPDFPEIFLEEHYGDWRTPVKTWDGAVDNPTIIDSNVAMQIILGVRSS